MSKIFFVNMAGHGHVNPTLALSQELVVRGHDVHYAVPPSFAEAAEATGAKYHGYDSLWHNATPPSADNMKEMMELTSFYRTAA